MNGATARFRAHCDTPGCAWQAEDSWAFEANAEIDAAAHDAERHAHAEVRREVTP